MQNKIIVLFLFSIGLLFFAGCNDSPTDLGSDYLNQDGIEVIKFDTSQDSMYQHITPFKYVYSLASSSYDLLGSSENITSKLLLKFIFAFPDSVKEDILNNNLIIKESWVEMVKQYSFGDSTAYFDYDVFKVNNYWSSLFSADSLSKLGYENTDYSYDHKIENDTLYKFGIDNSIVIPWLQNYSDTSIGNNNGILLSPKQGTNRIIGFIGYNYYAINDPRLKIVFEKPGVYADTITGFISSDISLVLGELPNVGSENVPIQSSLSGELKVFFDLSVLPKDVTINSANLSFTVDSAYTKTGSVYTNSLKVYLFTDSTDITVSSSYISVLDRNDSKFTGSITDMVRAIHNGTENQGFLVKASSDLDGVETFALKGSHASDVTKRPKLEIVYSRKK